MCILMHPGTPGRCLAGEQPMMVGWAYLMAGNHDS